LVALYAIAPDATAAAPLTATVSVYVPPVGTPVTVVVQMDPETSRVDRGMIEVPSPLKPRSTRTALPNLSTLLPKSSLLRE